IASLFGAIAFAFSGFMLTWLEYNVLNHVMYWLPAMLLVIDKYLKTKNGLYLGALSVSICFAVLAGYPQLVLLEGIAVFIFLLLRDFRKIPLFSLFAFLGLGLAAPQLLTGYELLNLSNRSLDNVVAALNSGFLPYKNFINFLIPDYFGNPTTLNWWGSGSYDNFATFIGITTFTLSLFALRFMWGKKEVKYAAILLVVSILLSIKSPLSLLISETNILGLKSAVAARALFLSTFAFSILAAFGMEKLKEGVSIKQSVRVLYIPFAILISIILATYSSKIWLTNSLIQFADYKEAFDIVNEWVRNLHIAFRNSAIPLATLLCASLLIFLSSIRQIRLLSLSALILLSTLELFRFGYKYVTFTKREYIYPPSKITDFLISKKTEEQPFRVLGGDVIPMNLLAPYGLETASGYESFYPLSYSVHLAKVNDGDLKQATGRYGDIKRYDLDFIDRMNVKYILGLKRDKIAKPSKTGKTSYIFEVEKLKPVFEDGSVIVYENTKAYPRAYLEGQGGSVKGEVFYENYTPNKSTLKVNSPEDADLIVSDQYYPGWTAKVDGVQTDMSPVEDVFRGIKIKAGEHTVEMEYKPKSFYDGLKVSAASLLILGLSMLYFLLKKRNA
ncbi:MAG: YfhO family protein, partial [bacterium]|nr:YfhO family protein [bacterium]